MPIYFPTSPPYSQIYIPPIPEGTPKTELFSGECRIVQAAKGGTLVLDEPGLASKKIQAMLLAAIEELDARIITETNRSLEPSVRSGDLREDLYRRLTQLRIRLPPLREHREVILPLAEYYLEQHCQALGLPPRTLEPDARSALLAYPWPDNIQELDNVLERIILLYPGATLTDAHLATCSGPPSQWRPGRDSSNLAPWRTARPRCLTTPPTGSTSCTAGQRWSRSVPACAGARGRASVLASDNDNTPRRRSIGRD